MNVASRNSACWIHRLVLVIFPAINLHGQYQCRVVIFQFAMFEKYINSH